MFYEPALNEMLGAEHVIRLILLYFLLKSLIL